MELESRVLSCFRRVEINAVSSEPKPRGVECTGKKCPVLQFVLPSKRHNTFLFQMQFCTKAKIAKENLNKQCRAGSRIFNYSELV